MSPAFVDRPTRRRLARPLLLLLAACALPVEAARSASGVTQDETMVAGTWTGTSICVGDRPACKNEEVVYRFVPVEGQRDLFTLLADKIIDGKRVAMYKLKFSYTASDQSLTCEFTRGQTHGIWEYKTTSEAMTGTLVVLPDKSLARRVSVHRVRDDQVPKPPSLDEYGILWPQRNPPLKNAEPASAAEAPQSSAVCVAGA